MAGREPYSPKYRTALVLTGTGTAGAYHAGVLRALAEAGVRIDLVAGHGAGAIGACFTAIEGGPALWSQDGCWRQKPVAGFYAWRPALRALGWASAAALALVLVPLAGLGVRAWSRSRPRSCSACSASTRGARSPTATPRWCATPSRRAAWRPGCRGRRCCWRRRCSRRWRLRPPARGCGAGSASGAGSGGGCSGRPSTAAP